MIRAIHDVPAPAKLNTFLHVIGRRPDGHHLLQSQFVLIDWADTLHVERREDGALQRHDALRVPLMILALHPLRVLASGLEVGRRALYGVEGQLVTLGGLAP